MIITFFKFKRRGRNNTGRITVRHRGSGIGFYKPNFIYASQNLVGNSYKLKDFFFSSQRNGALISLAKYNAVEGGYSIYFNRFNAKDIARPIFEYSIGQLLYDVELTPGRGTKICRSFGSYCQLLRKRGTYATLRLPSGEVRRVSVFCLAKVWSSLVVYEKPRVFAPNVFKAGYSRMLGVRPHVRGCAMNPVDHPHGGRTGDSRPSVSPWAQLTKGFRTRFKPINKKFVLHSVQAIKNRSKYTI